VLQEWISSVGFGATALEIAACWDFLYLKEHSLTAVPCRAKQAKGGVAGN
jgi:hypothetical protein